LGFSHDLVTRLQPPDRQARTSGKTLPHRNIVREFIRIGLWSGGNAHFALPAATRPGLATAVVVQSGPGGAIIAAARG
jgi:hypothetical protein